MGINRSITGLPEDASPTVDDWAVLVDVLTGLNKKALLSNILALAGTNVISQTVLTSGTGATYTVPAGVKKLWVRVQGPGGGAGGEQWSGAGQTAAGGGGGGGGYCEKVYTVTPGQTFTYTVPAAGGAGGAAGNNNGSAAASDTLWDSGGSVVTGGKGSGGTGMASGTSITNAPGGAGGAATGGTLNIPGGKGGAGNRYSGSVSVNGLGGSSLLGSASLSDINDVGHAGIGYGAGGSGAIGLGNSQPGGDGAPGVIIILELS